MRIIVCVMAFKGLDQAYRVQDFAFGALMALKEATQADGKQQPLSKDDAVTLGTAGKIWRDAQEQVRIHRGKPLPGSLKPESGKAPTRRAIRGAGKRDYIAAAAAQAAADAAAAVSPTADAADVGDAS